MPKPNRKCRICGKEYYMCNSCLETHNKNMFMRRTVTCDDDCFREYLRKVILNNESDSENTDNIDKIINRGGETMKILYKDKKTYEVEKIDNKKKTFKLKDTDIIAKKEDILGFTWIEVDDIEKLIGMFKEVNISKIKE